MVIGDVSGPGRRTQVPQSPPQTLLQMPFSHLPDTIGTDTIDGATIGADATGAATIGADATGADTVDADMLSSSDESARAPLDTRCLVAIVCGRRGEDMRVFSSIDGGARIVNQMWMWM